MKANPVAGQNIGAQYYYQNQFIVQIGSLDSDGERLVDQDGMRNLELGPFRIKFDLNASQDGSDAIDQSNDQASNTVTKANTDFLGGRTICAHIDGNADLTS